MHISSSRVRGKTRQTNFAIRRILQNCDFADGLAKRWNWATIKTSVSIPADDGETHYFQNIGCTAIVWRGGLGFGCFVCSLPLAVFRNLFSAISGETTTETIKNTENATCRPDPRRATSGDQADQEQLLAQQPHEDHYLGLILL